MATRAAEAATTHAVEPPPQLEDSSSNPDPRLQRQQEQQSPAILMRRQGTAPPGVVGSSSMQPHSPFLNAPASNMDAPTFPSSGAPAAPPRSASPGATRGASAFNPASRKANYASSYSPVFYDNSNAIGARSGPSPNGSNIQQATSSPSMAYSLLSSALPLISSLSPFRSSSSPASQSSSPRVPSSDVLSSPADASLMACFNPASLHPPLPPPRDNLGSRSLQHLRALIHQCLAEVESLPNPPSKSKLISATNRLSNRKNSTISFATDVWATPLYSIALEVAAEVPFVVDTLSPGLRGDSNRNSPDALHHTINVVSSPAGRPENSFYDPAQSDELGGTVKLFGVLEHEATTLECTMRFIIFCVCNLKLEMHMFQDHFVVRPEIPSDSQVDGAVDVVEVASASSSRTPLFGGAPMARRSHTTGSPLLRRGTSETLPLHSSASSLSEVEVADDEFNIVSPRRPMRPTPAPSTKRTSAGMLGRNLANSLWTWMRRSGSSLVGLPGENDSSWDASSQRSGRKSTTPDLDSDAKGAVPLSRPRRFFESLTQQLESTLLSVSPDVIFPPPHLLQRLKFEESMLLSPFDPSASTSSGLGSTASLTDNPKLAVIVGASNRPFPLPPSYTTAYAKAGMKNFITNNNSLMGMIKHQRLTFSYTYFWNSTSGLPCQQSKLLTVEYYSKSGNFQDRTLGQYIIMLCLRSDTPCRDGVCGGRPMGGHVTTYTHHNAKVVVTVKAGLPPKSIAVDSDPYLQLQTIVMWSECKDCGARTPFLPMSDSTWLYSFGKYLEVLIYNPKFFPNATRFGPPRFGQSACEHAGKGSDARRKLRRCFGYRWRVIAIEVEDIKVFELRGPRIQVLPASATVWPSRSSTPTQHLRSSHSSGRLSVNTDWKPLPSLPNALSLSNIGKARPESQSPPPGPIRRTIRPSSPPFVSSLKATFFSSRNATDSLKEVPSGVALTRSPSPTSPMEPERLASLPFPSENTRHHLFQDADLALQQTRRDIQLFYSSVRDHLTPFCGPLQSASPSSSTTTTATTANFTGSDGVSEAVNLVIPRMPDIRDANSALAPASESPRSSNDTAISPSAVALYPALAAAITASWAHPTRKSFFLSSSAPLSPIELDNTVLRLRAQMLTALEQCRVDESGLLLMLDNLSESGSMEKLNDVRRFFAEAVERVGAVCDGWEKDFSIKLDIRRFWECPEYIR
ncbi:hypothetical protein DFJ73DRAFT_438887 [Zopfochytrium polystomum]|nr:hypothetical protein DFJ73DRAFT_438887 [Zopfochytrium polystomum]